MGTNGKGIKREAVRKYTLFSDQVASCADHRRADMGV